MRAPAFLNVVASYVFARRSGLLLAFIRLKQTKNGKARALPFNETLWNLFSGLQTRQDIPWVFHDATGNRWNDIRHPFEAACVTAGLTDFHFHDLRHTFASGS